MNFLSLCSGCGGMDLGLERAGMKCVGQVEIMDYALKVLKRHWPKVPKHTDCSTLLRSDSLVKTYRRPTQKAKVLEGIKALSFSSVCESSTFLIQSGYLSRMFPDSFPSTTDGTWRLSFGRWPKAAMGGLTEFWTLNSSTAPNGAKECSLSDVLEDNVHPKYFLSKKAVAGMIRRTEKYGRSGYVFLQETENGKTKQLKRLSLQRFKQLITKKHSTVNLEMKETLSAQPFSLQIENYENSISEKTLLPVPASQGLSEQPQEETVALYGKTLILRKLTPTEKEKLQGFPENWTVVEE